MYFGRHVSLETVLQLYLVFFRLLRLIFGISGELGVGDVNHHL